MSIYKVYSIGPTWSWPVMLPRLVTLYDEPNISGGNLRRLDFSADFRRVTHLTWSQFVLVRQ